jgi:hypothetical protein
MARGLVDRGYQTVAARGSAEFFDSYNIYARKLELRLGSARLGPFREVGDLAALRIWGLASTVGWNGCLCPISELSK